LVDYQSVKGLESLLGVSDVFGKGQFIRIKKTIQTTQRSRQERATSRLVLRKSYKSVGSLLLNTITTRQLRMLRHLTSLEGMRGHLLDLQ
jgi:hypothetical protein